MVQLGTCAMKPRDAGGVVDSRLNVYGVDGLKVAGKLIYSPAYSCKDSHFPCLYLPSVQRIRHVNMPRERFCGEQYLMT